MEKIIFEPQYPAEFYTKRPNPTALLSPLYDSTFKAIFTQETEKSNFALKSFLSAVLGRQVLTVKLKNNEPVKETSKQKSMTFDVSVEFNNGELADIELQTQKEEYDYGMRAEVQAARLLTNNVKRKKKWESEKVYQISILNFQYKNDDNKEMRWYNMKDSSGGKLNDRLNIIFIDLVTIRKKYRNSPEKELSPLEKWGLFFSYVDHEKQKDLINKIVNTEEGIMAAEKIVKEMSKADNNWYVQNSIWVAKRDEYTRKAIAREKGLAEGRAEGRTQGIAEGRVEGRAQGITEGAHNKAIEVAKAMLADNMPLDKVALYSGLTPEQVKELADAGTACQV